MRQPYLQMKAARGGGRGWPNQSGRNRRADGVPDMSLLSLNEVCCVKRPSTLELAARKMKDFEAVQCVYIPPLLLLSRVQA